MFDMNMTPLTHRTSRNQCVSMWFHCDLLNVNALKTLYLVRQKDGKNSREKAGSGNARPAVTADQ